MLLAGCGKNELMKISEERSISSAPSSQESKSKPQARKEEESVSAFLKAYTNYHTLNEQKEKITPFLTKELQTALALNNPASPSNNSVRSSGVIEHLSKSKSGSWYGIVSVTVNEKTHHLAVLEMKTVSNKGQFQINSLKDLNQE